MDTTKQKILDAAINIFVTKGFSGSSMSVIAQHAGVNQSLIYHHIGNKLDLWKAVKSHLLSENIDSCPNYDSFQDFVSHVIRQRISIYQRDPRILRFIQWQMLEDEDEVDLSKQGLPTSWIANIQKFQNENKIKQDYSPPLIIIYIYSIINGLIFDVFNFFSQNAMQRENYTEMMITEITKTFGVDL